MKWIVLSVEGMPDGQGIAVVYGDVSELIELPSGNGADVPDEAWSALTEVMNDNDTADEEEAA